MAGGMQRAGLGPGRRGGAGRRRQGGGRRLGGLAMGGDTAPALSTPAPLAQVVPEGVTVAPDASLEAGDASAAPPAEGPLSADAAAAPANVGPITGVPPLELHMQGPEVAALQARLNELGAALTVDGLFGLGTLKAVRGFQNANGLADDGLVGARTAAALQGGSARPIGSGPVPRPRPRPADLGQGTQGTGGASAATPASGGAQAAPAEGLESGQLSANFAVGEFASHDGAPTPQEVQANLRELAAQLEVLKAELGGAAVSIMSGYRSPAHNREVGGATNSEHMQGRAADIKVAGFTPRQVADTIERLIREGRMKQGGLGRYASFTHYDTRGTAARW
ncbi:MAG: hypothetical protein RLZZ383_1769 [Pseudomonadota bacterium]